MHWVNVPWALVKENFMAMMDLFNIFHKETQILWQLYRYIECISSHRVLSSKKGIYLKQKFILNPEWLWPDLTYFYYLCVLRSTGLPKRMRLQRRLTECVLSVISGRIHNLTLELSHFKSLRSSLQSHLLCSVTLYVLDCKKF